VGSAFLFSSKQIEFNSLTREEMQCFVKCNRMKKAAIIVDFLEPTGCFCGTEYELRKKVFPKNLKKALRESRVTER